MMRSFFQTMLRMLRTAWLAGLLVTVVLALSLWFLGPLVAVAGYVVFGSVVSRLAGILVIVFVWGLLVAVFSSRQRKKEAADPELAARRERDAEARERGREKLGQIRRAIAQAVRTVTTSNFYGPTSRSRYALPWYLVIGTPSSGKTSMLLNSGLSFPLNEQADRHLYNLESTRNVDVLFANQAVFIDTPGGFVESVPGSTGHGLWRSLLRHLFRVRPARALNGLVVCVSMRDMLDVDSAKREHLARMIRARLGELLKSLRAYIPVYLVFTKCDAVPGFAQFFAHLSRSEREQVFGCPARANTMDAEMTRNEFRDLMQVLNAQIITKIHQERDCLARAGMFRFPQELAALGSRFEEFIFEAFGPSRYHRPVMFRGFFYSSALSSSGIIGGVAREGELPYQSGFQPSLGDYAKGFFLLRLLQDVIVPEAGLASADRERLWMLRFRRFGLQAAAGLLLVFAVSLLGWSFRDNFSRTEAFQRVFHEYEQVRGERRDGADAASALPELAVLEKTMTIYRPDDDPFIVRRLGLYQGQALGGAAREAYARGLRSVLLPRVRLMAVKAIGESHDNLGALKSSLRAYLMLCQPEKLHSGFLKGWLERRWAGLYPGRADDQMALMKHMSRLIELGYPETTPDSRTLERVRAALLKKPLSQLAYLQMKEEASESGRSSFTFRGALGEHLSPFSGDTYPVPYLYTPAGFQEYVLDRCPEIIRGMTEDSWIFGPKPPLFSTLDTDRISKEVRGMYFRDYAQHWSEALQELHVKRPRSMAAAGTLADQLCAGVSPVVLVLRELRKNITIEIRERGQENVEDAMEAEAARKGARKLTPLVGGRLAKTAADNLAEAAADVLEDRGRDALRDAQLMKTAFNPLDSLLDVEGNPAPALKAANDAMIRAKDYFRNISGRENRGSLAFKALQEILEDRDDAPHQMQTAAERLPAPVKQWYAGVVPGGLDDMLGTAAAEIDAAYRETVLRVYKGHLKTLFPFDLQSERDVSLAEFGNFFKRHGVLDAFHDTYIKPFVDGRGMLRPILGNVLPISEQSIAQLNQAHKVRDAFFVSDEDIEISLLIEPYALDVTLKQADLIHGQQTLSYWHGPVQGMNFVWPLDSSKAPEASFATTDTRSIKAFRRIRGDWAFFRLLRHGTIKRQDGNSCLVEMQENGKWAQYRVQYRSKSNPLDPATCNFSLPESLL